MSHRGKNFFKKTIHFLIEVESKIYSHIWLNENSLSICYVLSKTLLTSVDPRHFLVPPTTLSNALIWQPLKMKSQTSFCLKFWLHQYFSIQATQTCVCIGKIFTIKINNRHPQAKLFKLGAQNTNHPVPSSLNWSWIFFLSSVN